MKVLGRGVTTDTVLVEMTGQEYAAYQRGQDRNEISNHDALRNRVVTNFGVENHQYVDRCSKHEHVATTSGFPCPECAVEKGEKSNG